MEAGEKNNEMEMEEKSQYEKLGQNKIMEMTERLSECADLNKLCGKGNEKKYS